MGRTACSVRIRCVERTPGGRQRRRFGFWTSVKLEVLSEYLQKFTTASYKKADERIYIDAFAGEGVYEDRLTGQEMLGSARRALEVDPPFTILRYFERQGKAEQLEADLRREYPGRDIRVIPGDCNETIGQALEELEPVRWAPTFAFLDPDGMELAWETVAELAAFRRVGKGTKAEIWMLFASGGMLRTLVLEEGRDASETDHARVTRVLGTEAWHAYYELRRRGEIDARTAREAYVNLLRWRLEKVLGYDKAHALEVPNEQGVPLYHMVFATDHPVGNSIMTQLYKKTSARLPAIRQRVRDERRGLGTLFDPEQFSAHERYEYRPPVPPDEFELSI